jgi:hypothetical protein
MEIKMKFKITKDMFLTMQKYNLTVTEIKER